MAKANDWQCPHCGERPFGILIAVHDVAFRMGAGRPLERAKDYEEKGWKCNDCDGTLTEANIPDEIVTLLIDIRDSIDRRLDEWHKATTTSQQPVDTG